MSCTRIATLLVLIEGDGGRLDDDPLAACIAGRIDIVAVPKGLRGEKSIRATAIKLARGLTGEAGRC